MLLVTHWHLGVFAGVTLGALFRLWRYSWGCHCSFFCFSHGFSGRARRFLVTCWNSTCSLVSWDLTTETLLDFLQGSFFRAENWTSQKICSRGGNILLILTRNQPGFCFSFVFLNNRETPDYIRSESRVLNVYLQQLFPTFVCLLRGLSVCVCACDVCACKLLRQHVWNVFCQHPPPRDRSGFSFDLTAYSNKFAFKCSLSADKIRSLEDS